MLTVWQLYLFEALLCVNWIGSVTLLLVYVYKNKGWRKSSIGRALVPMATVFVLTFSYSVLRLVFHVPQSAALSLGLYAIIAAMIIGLDVAFIRERIRYNREVNKNRENK